MASIEEQETTITINRADLRDGYFRFGTSEVSDFNKLLKKCPREKLVEVRESRKDGKTVYWSCKVPAEHLSLIDFRLKSARSLIRSEKQIAASLAQGRVLAERRQKHA